MGQIIDGKALSRKIREDLKLQIDELRADKGIIPGLCVILVGDDPASHVYVRNKERACNEVGIYSNVLRLPSHTTQAQLLDTISALNNDSSIHGILVQLPLPEHIDEDLVIQSISPVKDVDGFHPLHAGRLLTGQASLEPCTPKGIMHLIQETGQEIMGKTAVVIGRSNIVGKPVALMLLQKNATVTIAHSRTKNLMEIAKQADILVVAIGKPLYITGDYIKEGAIVIDVGTSRVNDTLCGDVVFEEAMEKAAYVTPVPGGVGPMTITMLLKNTVLCAKGFQ